LGRYADAAAAFQKAADLKPHSALYWRNVGDALRFTPGREADSRRAFERALTLCDDTLRVNPGDARAHRTRACALAKVGRHREARAAILRALELEPKLATNAYEAAVIANIGSDEEETTARIEQALRLGYDAKDLQRDPEFAALRKSGRLDAIITGFRSNPEQH
jgi:serine/threonine-protein kinase